MDNVYRDFDFNGITRPRNRYRRLYPGSIIVRDSVIGIVRVYWPIKWSIILCQQRDIGISR